jgi:hypothetical protein
MRLPEPAIRAWAKPGGILSVGTTTLALSLAVIAFDWLVATVSIAILLLLVVLELLRYSTRVEDDRDHARDAAEIHEVELRRERTALVDAERENSTLTRRLQRLRIAAVVDQPTLEQTFSTLQRTLQPAQQAIRHRDIASGADGWLVTELVLTDAGDVQVSADLAGAEIATLAPEELVLQPLREAAIPVRAATVGPGTIRAACLLADLAPELADELQARGRIHPAGYKLALSGLADSTFKHVSPVLLRELVDASEGALQAIRAAMQAIATERDQTEEKTK